MEAVQLSYAYLEREGYQVQMQVLGGITDDFMYDIYTTNKGSVWFKVPRVRA